MPLWGREYTIKFNSMALLERFCNFCTCEYRDFFLSRDIRACGNCSRGVLADCFRSQCIPADGYERGVMSVNRKIPGPQLHVCKDDLMVVVVANRMTGTGSTLHWHGIQQKNTPSMDGVPRISQCPIGSGEVFTYVFPVEVRRLISICSNPRLPA